MRRPTPAFECGAQPRLMSDLALQQSKHDIHGLPWFVFGLVAGHRRHRRAELQPEAGARRQPVLFAVDFHTSRITFGSDSRFSPVLHSRPGT